MAGTTVTVEEPDLVETKSVDASGRLYLGKGYEGANVRVIVERVEKDDEEDESAFARGLSQKSIANQHDDYYTNNPDWDEDLPDLGENA